MSYVNPDHHHYLADPEHREEGGTPAIVESIRAGLVFKLKEAVGVDRIRRLEHSFIRRAIESWSENPFVRILGNPEADRLSIVSFVVRAPEHLGIGRFLHHNFVVAVLNDVFGIQARGGCSCAGPYGHRLLGIDLATSQRFEHEISEGCEVIKPGWVRINFNYFISEEEFSYLVDAVHLMANEGWRLLPDYEFDVATSVWRHRSGTPEPPMTLETVEFGPQGLSFDSHLHRADDSHYEEYLAEARRIFSECAARPSTTPRLTPAAESLRWFPLPDEVG